MRIALVNDLALAVESLRRVIAGEPRHSIAWVARDGEEALRRAQADRPDLILMDLVMPGLDGVEATRRIMASCPCPILIVTASVGGNQELVYRALGHGALDVTPLPPLATPPQRAGGELLRKIATLERLRGRSRAPSAAGGAAPLVAIGASTGGPKALLSLLGGLPADLPAALVVVQHIDAQFTPGLVTWLDAEVPLPVALAVAGERPLAGRVLVACSNDHLVMEGDGRLAYTAEPLDRPYRPSVDVFFDSLARHGRRPGVAVLLSGMGRDGAEGLLALRRAGWHTIAQDEGSCAVYGMPRAAAELAAAVEVLPPEAIAASLRGRFAVPG